MSLKLSEAVRAQSCWDRVDGPMIFTDLCCFLLFSGVRRHQNRRVVKIPSGGAVPVVIHRD